MNRQNALADSFDTLVFGSGLAGLAYAKRAAQKGQRVCVLEKSSQLGGHLLPFERAGVTFEVGIHYIADTHNGSLFAQTCQTLGLQIESIALEDTFEELCFEDGKTFFYKAPFPEFLESLISRFGKQYEKPLRHYQEACEVAWNVTNQIQFPCRTLDILRVAVKHPKRMLLAQLATSTLDEYLRNYLKLPHEMVEILSAQHLLMGVAPRRISALLYLIVHRYYFEKPCFVKGGGREMIAQLLTSQVDYRTSQNARLAHSSRPRTRFEALLSTGEKIYSQNVVWTADPRALALSSDIRPGALARFRLSEAENPHALVVCYFATRSDLQQFGFGNRNSWLMGTLSANESYGETNLELLARRGLVYVSTGSLRDPLAISPKSKLGAKGVFQAMFLVPPQSELWGGQQAHLYRKPESKGGFGRAYRQKKDALLEIIKDRLEKNFPGVCADLVWEELGTPLTHGRYLNSLSGNGYGYSATVFDLIIGRPSFRSGVEGLYFCGGHIKPAHGIVTSLANGVGLAERLHT